MNIKKLFKKTKKDDEKGAEAKGLIEKHKNPQTIEMGLSILRSMPKWQQKAMIRMLPKAERETVKKALDFELDADELLETDKKKND